MAKKLIHEHGWPFADCPSRLIIKLREWNESAKGSSKSHASRQMDYKKRKAEVLEALPVQQVQPSQLAQQHINEGVDRLQRLTQIEVAWRQATLSQCAASPEPEPVPIHPANVEKPCATTFQKEFKKAHMKVWSALKEVPKVCPSNIAPHIQHFSYLSGCTPIGCPPYCRQGLPMVVWTSL